MPVQQSFVPCVLGQWTQVCQYMENRKSLLICIQGADAVLSITTASPLVPTSFGTMPAGFFLSTTDGTGPGTFDLSAWLDGEAVQQAWFAWTLPTTFTQNPIEPGFATINNVGGAPPTTVSVSYDLNVSNPDRLPADLIIVVVYSVLALVAQPTLTSAVAGVLMPFAGGGGGDATFYTSEAFLYWYLNPSAADTLTVSSNADGALQVEVYAIQFGTGPDQFISQAGGTPANLSLPDPPQTATEIAFGALIVDLSAVPNVPAGWTQTAYPQFMVALVPAPFWSALTIWQVVNTSNLITISNWVPNIGPVYGLGMGAWLYDLTQLAAPVAAVLQSFDLPDPIPAGQGPTFHTGLPKLSPEGVAALVDLQKRLGSQPENQNANADVTDDV